MNALLARHHFILLGLRGQAKSRILRELTGLLDERIPVVAGSEVNDDPFAPISKYARDMLGECGDATPIAWLRRDQRYVEKLATPDVTIADLIGDVDPIKAARGGHLLSDELTMHFGLLPRANRGHLRHQRAARPQRQGAGRASSTSCRRATSRSKAIRCGCRSTCCSAFTANPEDYTARGKIITPLKDRIGSEIITHYPAHRAARAWRSPRRRRGPRRGGRAARRSPTSCCEVIERVAFEAREDKRVDKRSGREPAAADQRAGERGVQRRAARDGAGRGPGRCRG